jgi:Universal stress protein family
MSQSRPRPGPPGDGPGRAGAVSEHVVEGPGGPALLSQAADATLLVVGARGRAAYPGLLLGSVAEYCVRNGPCPVAQARYPALSGPGTASYRGPYSSLSDEFI